MHKPMRGKKGHQRSVQKNPIKRGNPSKSPGWQEQPKKRRGPNEPWPNDPFDKKDF